MFKRRHINDVPLKDIFKGRTRSLPIGLQGEKIGAFYKRASWTPSEMSDTELYFCRLIKAYGGDFGLSEDKEVYVKVYGVGLLTELLLRQWVPPSLIVNAASPDDLLVIYGVGPKKARLIFEKQESLRMVLESLEVGKS